MRLAAHVPRLLLLGAVFLFAGATLTYGAARRLSADSAVAQTGPVSAPTVVVPDLTGQAFVFAKGTLEDGGFAWRVLGGVHGFAANRVVAQSPAAGTKLQDTGAPTVTVTLSRSGYAETGEPEDVSPYIGTPLVLAAPLRTAPLSGAEQKPARTAVVKTAAPKVAAAPTKIAKKSATKRPPAFVRAGAPKEPLKEMPLQDRARLLSSWLAAHPKPSSAAVRHFLYQNAWIVTGAKFGWWRGAEALRTLIAADRKAEALWGVGHKSELAARHALAEVQARSH
jgi:hypothetical protein